MLIDDQIISDHSILGHTISIISPNKPTNEEPPIISQRVLEFFSEKLEKNKSSIIENLKLIIKTEITTVMLELKEELITV
jgi:hypothetical protein